MATKITAMYRNRLIFMSSKRFDSNILKPVLLATICTLLFGGTIASAQSVVITPKKTVYTRPKPISDYKKTFTVTYPKVKASTPALSRKIESAISYSKVLELNVREEISDVQWLEEADFEVNYNARGILVITLSMNGSGAYPDGTSKTVVVNLRTGSRITPGEAFTNVSGLVALIRTKQKAEVAAAIKELKEDPEERDTDHSELFEGKVFTVEDLNEFALDDRGVTFIYDYGFPHVIKALEPEGRYTFKWAAVARFIKPAGPLAKFAGR